MQSNTVAVGIQDINFANFSVENRKSDPFTVVDGRYIGHDGFVVPKNFAEFHQRFPEYVRNWMIRHAASSTSQEHIEDWTQDLLIHLSRLPLTSKYREAGKKDIVQTFDQLKHYGANEARFRNYVNLCLANKFRTIHSKRMKDAVCRAGNVSFDGLNDGEDLHYADEFCHEHSAQLRGAAKALEKQCGDRAFLAGFVNFARQNDAKALPTIRALMTTGTRSEAAYWLGVAELEFDRMHTRVRHLARCFVSGEPVPKRRRPYKKRGESSPCELVG